MFQDHLYLNVVLTFKEFLLDVFWKRLTIFSNLDFCDWNSLNAALSPLFVDADNSKNVMLHRSQKTQKLVEFHGSNKKV